MDVSTITQLINTMGFPIVMVGYFIWDKNKCMSKMIEAINNNTQMMERLYGKLDHEEGEK